MSKGRPVKKPGYSREDEIKNLINKAVKLADEPFDEDEDRDPNLPTMTEISDAMGTTYLRVRKLLITANYFTSANSRNVQALADRDYSIAEIMRATGLSQASVYSYLPYSKGVYNLAEPTLYSKQGKRYRLRRAAVVELEQHASLPDVLLSLWKTVIAFQDYTFITSGRGQRPGVKFKYEVSKPGGNSGRRYNGTDVPGYGNELWIIVDVVKHDKSISRSTVDLAYRNGIQLMKTEGCVRGPKALGVPGAGSYLYPILLRFGVIKRKPDGEGYLDHLAAEGRPQDVR